MNNSILYTKPLQKIPQRLIYKTPLKGSYLYQMADTQTGKCVGQMLGNIETESMFSNYYPSLKTYNSFKIHYLVVNPMQKGHGKAFINFAKSESLKQNGKGRIHLDASRMFFPNKPPHIFYRKLGFDSTFTDTIKYIDKCIKKHKQMNPLLAIDIPMFLCPKVKANQPKPNLLNKLISSIKKLIKV